MYVNVAKNNAWFTGSNDLHRVYVAAIELPSSYGRLALLMRRGNSRGVLAAPLRYAATSAFSPAL